MAAPKTYLIGGHPHPQMGVRTMLPKVPAAPIHGRALPARKTVIVNGQTSLVGKITGKVQMMAPPSKGPKVSAPIIETQLGKPGTRVSALHAPAAKTAPLDAHQLHAQHAAAVAKRATKTSTGVAAAKSTAKSSGSTLDAHQLHLLHLQHIGAVSGATSSPINPPDPGGGVSPAQGAPGVASTTTGGTLTSSLMTWGLRIAVLLLLIWAWKKGYLKGITKGAGKLIKGGGSKLGKVL
jgi:hypothetical protein